MPKVLVIDDQKDIAEIIKTVLEESGAEVKSHFTPEKIKEEIQEYKPDILFLDYNIPGVNVEKLVKEIKPQNIKIILITGQHDIQNIGKKLHVQTLAKPFDINTLTQLLRS